MLLIHVRVLKCAVVFLMNTQINHKLLYKLINKILIQHVSTYSHKHVYDTWKMQCVIDEWLNTLHVSNQPSWCGCKHLKLNWCFEKNGKLCSWLQCLDSVNWCYAPNLTGVLKWNMFDTSLTGVIGLTGVSVIRGNT